MPFITWRKLSSNPQCCSPYLEIPSSGCVSSLTTPGTFIIFGSISILAASSFPSPVSSRSFSMIYSSGFFRLGKFYFWCSSLKILWKLCSSRPGILTQKRRNYDEVIIIARVYAGPPLSVHWVLPVFILALFSVSKPLCVIFGRAYTHDFLSFYFLLFLFRCIIIIEPIFNVHMPHPQLCLVNGCSWVMVVLACVRTRCDDENDRSIVHWLLSAQTKRGV